jgi:hypothetical protein
VTIYCYRVLLSGLVVLVLGSAKVRRCRLCLHCEKELYLFSCFHESSNYISTSPPSPCLSESRTCATSKTSTSIANQVALQRSYRRSRTANILAWLRSYSLFFWLPTTKADHLPLSHSYISVSRLTVNLTSMLLLFSY